MSVQKVERKSRLGHKIEPVEYRCSWLAVTSEESGNRSIDERETPPKYAAETDGIERKIEPWTNKTVACRVV